MNFFYEIREQKSITNKFSKSTKFFHEIRELFFVFVLKCTQREDVHNLNIRWARSALKALYYKYQFSNSAKLLSSHFLLQDKNVFPYHAYIFYLEL